VGQEEHQLELQRNHENRRLFFHRPKLFLRKETKITLSNIPLCRRTPPGSETSTSKEADTSEEETTPRRDRKPISSKSEQKRKRDEEQQSLLEFEKRMEKREKEREKRQEEQQEKLQEQLSKIFKTTTRRPFGIIKENKKPKFKYSSFFFAFDFLKEQEARYSYFVDLFRKNS